MPRSRRNTVTRRLANGEVKTYTYGGNGSRVDEPPERTVADLIRAYKESPDFTHKKPDTQHLYRHALKHIDGIRHFPLDQVEPEDVDTIREDLANTPGIANATLAVLQKMFQLARRRRWVTSNPVSGIERFETGEGEPWPTWAIDRFRAKASDEWVFRFDLALLTVQRRGDIVRARWSAYDGTGIEFLQQKSGSLVYMPVPQLVEELNARKKATKGLTIIADARGRPYTPKSFSNAWNEEMKRIGLHGKGLKFHGLRHTGLTWMAERGATESQLAAASGHQTLAMVRRYTKRANQRQMATVAASLLPVLAKRQNNGA